MAAVANTTAPVPSASQPSSQQSSQPRSQGSGQQKRTAPQNGNGNGNGNGGGKAKPKYEFAPNIGTGQITYQPKVRGPRWACPVKGHTDHTLAQCKEFWGAENCFERRKMLAGTGCYTCLGRDQGCGTGTCFIVKEVPKDTICQECASYTNRSGTPPNILCCGLAFHKKPVIKDVVEIMERWIPGFPDAHGDMFTRTLDFLMRARQPLLSPFPLMHREVSPFHLGIDPADCHGLVIQQPPVLMVSPSGFGGVAARLLRHA